MQTHLTARCRLFRLRAKFRIVVALLSSLIPRGSKYPKRLHKFTIVA